MTTNEISEAIQPLMSALALTLKLCGVDILETPQFAFMTGENDQIASIVILLTPEAQLAMQLSKKPSETVN